MSNEDNPLRTIGWALVGLGGIALSAVGLTVGMMKRDEPEHPEPKPPPNRHEMIEMLETFLATAPDKRRLKYEFGILISPQITLDLQRLLDGLKQEESDGDGHSDSR